MTVLETPRLTLRPPRSDDWPAYRSYRLTPRSTLPMMPEAEAWTHFAAFFGHWALRGFGRFVITLRDTGQPVGHAGPFHPAGNPEPEITWTLWSPAHEGLGLAFEAAAAARDHAFATLGWPTAVSYIDTGNRRSIALAERLGARRDARAQTPGPGTLVYRHVSGHRSAGGRAAAAPAERIA